MTEHNTEKTVCPFCSSEWVTAEQHDRKMDRLEQEPENRCVRELREFAKSNQGAYIFPSWDGHRVLKYLGDTTPQRKPLTDEEMLEILVGIDADTKRLPPGFKAFARAIEAKLKERKTHD